MALDYCDLEHLAVELVGVYINVAKGQLIQAVELKLLPCQSGVLYIQMNTIFAMCGLFGFRCDISKHSVLPESKTICLFMSHSLRNASNVRTFGG